MEYFILDKEKCNQDGICVSVCPMQILEMKDNFPTMKKGFHIFCINCGHCISVCPKEAIELNKMKKQDCLDLKNFKISIEDTEKFLRRRRSIRVYKDKEVDKNLLEKLIDLARYAPSGHNSQPLNWTIVYDKAKVIESTKLTIEFLKALKEKNPQMARAWQADALIKGWENNIDLICRNAPHLIFAHSNKSIFTAPIAGFNAIAYLELAAPSFGLGTCWAGFLSMAISQYSPLKKLLQIPEENDVYGIVMIGYPKFQYKKAPSRKLKEILCL